MKLVWFSLILLVASVVHEAPVQSQTTDGTNQNAATTTTPQIATYWAFMSNTIRPGHPLDLLVQILDGYNPVTVTVTITFTKYEVNSTAENLLISSPTEVLPGAPQMVKVDIPIDIIDYQRSMQGAINVLVHGQGPTLNFTHQGYVTLQQKSFSTFIVTDKAMYKEGQTMNFRVLVVEPNTMKVSNVPMDIVILDSENNRIKQFLGIQGTNSQGVVQESLSLVEGVPEGEWKISVTVQGQNTEKTFTVAKYVLPKFSVDVNPPANALSSGPPLRIRVVSKYTFGKPVAYALVDLRISLKEYFPTTEVKGLYRNGKLNSNGELSFDISTKQLLSLVMTEFPYVTDLAYFSFMVDAVVTEFNTGRKQNGSAVMEIHSSPLKANFLPVSQANFKQGLFCTAHLEVKRVDDTKFLPKEASQIKVRFNVTYEVPIPEEELTTTEAPVTTDSSKANSNSSDIAWSDKMFNFNPWRPTSTRKILELETPVQTLPATGYASCTFTVPKEASSVQIEATFDKPFEKTSVTHYIGKFESPSSTYVQISAPLKIPKIGDSVTIKVESTEPMTKFTYLVLAKSMLVDSAIVESPTPEGSKSTEFTIKITQGMSPSISIVVFYVRKENSEIVADAVSLIIDGLFQKNLSLEFSTDKVKPGEKFNLTIRTEPDSLAFFQVIDISTDELKTGNSLTPEVVQDDLTAYSSGYLGTSMRSMFLCGLPAMFEGGDVSTLFRKSNLLVFTDGLVYRSNISPRDFIAFNSMGGKESASEDKKFFPADKVRKNFLEQISWDYHVVSPSGELQVQLESPDQLTTLVGKAFAVHPLYGLSVASDTPEITTFLTVSVSLDLPFSITRNESFCFNASIFSYHPEPIQVLLTLESSEYYNGIYIKRVGHTVTTSSEKKACSDFHADVDENEVRSSVFCFTPIVTGDVPLKVSALTNIPGLSDAVEQVIKVKPEGYPRSNSYPSLVNLTDGVWQTEINIIYPQETVADSDKVTFSVAGSLMGSIYENMEDLLGQPYGCGEQNMLKFAPNTVISRFFMETNTFTPKIRERVAGYITSGYYTEKKYEHGTTGGYSAFGSSDAQASTWLSAFVGVSFIDLAILQQELGEIISINMTGDILRTTQFLMSNQNTNGSFSEHGIVFHKEMQGGSAEGEALTAYVLIAIFKASQVLKDHTPVIVEIQNSIKRAAAYLVERTNSLRDPFDITIVSYVLNLMNHSLKDQIFYKMEQIAITKDGVKYWERVKTDTFTSYAWSHSTDPISIEMTSYALLTYFLRGIGMTDGLPIIRWLISQMNANGGFISTQDTMIGIQALTMPAVQLHKTGDHPMTITVSYVDGEGKSQSSSIQISKSTELLQQRVQIPRKNNLPSSLQVQAKTDNGASGLSSALVSVILNYNVKGEAPSRCFDLSHNVTQLDTGLQLTITIVPFNANSASMTLLEVDIPAGYTADSDEVAKKNKYISRVDPSNGQKVAAYFNAGVIEQFGTSVTIVMYKTGGTLATAEPKSYTFSDYYKPSCSETKFYILDISPYCTQVPDYGICRYV